MYLRREDLNLRMAESKSAALPLGDAPFLINYMEIEYKCQSSNQYNTSIGQEGIRTILFVIWFLKSVKNVSEAGGFEPTNGGVKVRCLTAWRRPIFNKLYGN